MTKAELIEAIAEKAQVTRVKAESVVNTIFETMVETLLKGDRIEIRGFGSFVNRDYRAYLGRNPKTSEYTPVAEKRLPFFKPGKGLREELNEAPNEENSEN